MEFCNKYHWKTFWNCIAYRKIEKLQNEEYSWKNKFPFIFLKIRFKFFLVGMKAYTFTLAIKYKTGFFKLILYMA